ncbi:MAG: hypothetical protein RLZZ338_469 [Cyanobacteriota bacterium]|jgi:hypothetical protein
MTTIYSVFRESAPDSQNRKAPKIRRSRVVCHHRRRDRELGEETRFLVISLPDNNEFLLRNRVSQDGWFF